ncbi:MAG: hypothetical protein AAGH76_15005 [Pseudomonadota bacterium]
MTDGYESRMARKASFFLAKFLAGVCGAIVGFTLGPLFGLESHALDLVLSGAAGFAIGVALLWIRSFFPGGFGGSSS